jgi:hypothetical protein
LVTYFATAIFSNLLLRFASLILILKDTEIIPSFKKSYELLINKLFDSFLTWLIYAGLSILIGLVIILSLVVFTLLLLGLGFLIYKLSFSAVIIYAILAGLLLLATFLVAYGYLNSFFQSYWVLSYKSLIQKK